MSALQKVFSQHEKIKAIIAALDKINDEGKIELEQYKKLKTSYDAYLKKALENLKAIRNKLKEEFNQIQINISNLNNEGRNILLQYEAGELSKEEANKMLQPIKSNLEVCQHQLNRLKLQLAARSSKDLGGYVEVDLREYAQNRSDSRSVSQNISRSDGVSTDQRIKIRDGNTTSDKVENKKQVFNKPFGSGFVFVLHKILRTVYSMFLFILSLILTGRYALGKILTTVTIILWIILYYFDMHNIFVSSVFFITFLTIVYWLYVTKLLGPIVLKIVAGLLVDISGSTDLSNMILRRFGSPTYRPSSSSPEPTKAPLTIISAVPDSGHVRILRSDNTMTAVSAPRGGYDLQSCTGTTVTLRSRNDGICYVYDAEGKIVTMFSGR